MPNRSARPSAVSESSLASIGGKPIIATWTSINSVGYRIPGTSNQVSYMVLYPSSPGTSVAFWAGTTGTHCTKPFMYQVSIIGIVSSTLVLLFIAMASNSVLVRCPTISIPDTWSEIETATPMWASGLQGGTLHASDRSSTDR